jgi:hypothetical protein
VGRSFNAISGKHELVMRIGEEETEGDIFNVRTQGQINFTTIFMESEYLYNSYTGSNSNMQWAFYNKYYADKYYRLKHPEWNFDQYTVLFWKYKESEGLGLKIGVFRSPSTDGKVVYTKTIQNRYKYMILLTNG